MNRRVLFQQAFELAFYLHQDEDVALQIVTGAAAKLDVAATSQRKRLYYRPDVRGSRSAASGFRHKMLLSEVHLLQRLVYVESEPFERSYNTLRKDALIIYFIKHLVRITIRRNSFHVNLGISRLLYNYRTAEAMEIYNVAIQDPARVKDDYYYRSRKGLLMSELKERFGQLLRTCRVARGEERFEMDEHSNDFIELVKETLRRFTPWETSCLVPDEFDPSSTELAGLASSIRNGDDVVEINRVHSILHPRCYQNLVKAVGLSTPDQHLAIPFFFSEASDSDDGPTNDRTRQVLLSDQKYEQIEAELVAQANRRRRGAQGILRVLVDGEEKAVLEAAGKSSLRISVPESAELIEVMNADGLLLATHLINRAQLGKEWTVSDAKYLVSFSLSQTDGSDELTIEFKRSLLERLLGFESTTFLWRAAMVSAALIIVALVIVIAYRMFRVEPPGREVEVWTTPQPSPVIPPSPTPTPEPQQVNKRGGPTPEPRKERSTPAPLASPQVANKDQTETGGMDETRSTAPGSAGVRLRDVRKVVVESTTNGEFAEFLRRALGTRLATNRDDADAVMKVSRNRIQLINASGVVLWSTVVTGSNQASAEKITTALESAIANSK